MEMIRETLRFVHIALGFTGLAAFWVPVFARKGSRPHVLFGKIFAWCVYIVAGSAVVNSILILAIAVGQGHRPSEDPSTFGFLVFLCYLGIVTFASGRHAVRVVEAKGDPMAINTAFHRSLAVSSALGSVVVIAYALVFWTDASIIFLMLSVIGLAQWHGMRRYMSAPPAFKMSWWYEHMGAMLGTGVAFHTAFAVFGAGRLFGFTLTGSFAFVPWILPTAIGLPAIAIWTRYYQRKFGEAQTEAVASA